MARKTLEEKLADNQRILEQMEKDFAEKKRALKLTIEAQKKQQSAAYQKKRTHTLCTVAPMAMYLFRRYEDNTAATLDQIIADFKAATEKATSEQLDHLYEYFNSIVAGPVPDEKQAEHENVPRCEKCGTIVSDAVVDFCNRRFGGKLLCMECQKAMQENK